jgi:hypothetical protein
VNRKLLDAVDRVDHRRLAVCAHEVGHALTWIAGGIEIKEVYLKKGLFSGFAGGRCEVVDAPGRDCPRDLREGYLVGIVGGHAAEVRFCQLYLGMSARKAFRYGRDWAEGDYLNYPHWRSKLGLGGMSWSGGMSADAAFDRATRILRRQQRRLDELTVRLERTRYLHGGEL